LACSSAAAVVDANPLNPDKRETPSISENALEETKISGAGALPQGAWQSRVGARRSRRFNVQPAAGADSSNVSAARTLKRT